jgi:hypothetical protein
VTVLIGQPDGTLAGLVHGLAALDADRLPRTRSSAASR